LLLEAATRAGVQFEPGVAVRRPLVESRLGRLRGACIAASRLGASASARQAGVERDTPARLVIAADGRRSRLAFALGLATYAARPRRWAFGTYYTDVDGLTSCGEMHIRSDGYVGVAPLPNGLTNVCVVRELASSAGANRCEPERLVDCTVATDPALRDRFARARRVTGVSALGPLAVETRAAGVPGLLLAGDAAGFIDPMTGDGLRFAIRGAELAAEYALRELDTGRPMHAQLWSARRREFAGKWRMNRILRTVVASPHAVSAAARVASVWGAPVKALIAMAGDVNTVDARPQHRRTE
jgi:flavin-dependent dehydrogenase